MFREASGLFSIKKSKLESRLQAHVSNNTVICTLKCYGYIFCNHKRKISYQSKYGSVPQKKVKKVLGLKWSKSLLAIAYKYETALCEYNTQGRFLRRQSFEDFVRSHFENTSTNNENPIECFSNRNEILVRILL